MASIEKNIEKFSVAGCKVVVVSFGSAEGAQRWLKETGCELDVYLDPERKLYSLVGLGRSVYKVWNIGTLRFYAQEIAKGVKPPEAFAGDDFLQMGGDFTLDKELKMVLSYPSKDPSDRVSIDNILGKMK